MEEKGPRIPSNLSIVLLVSLGSLLLTLLVATGRVTPGTWGGAELARLLSGGLSMGVLVLIGIIGAAISRRWVATILLVVLLLPLAYLGSQAAIAVGDWRDDRRASGQQSWRESPLDSAGLIQELHQLYPDAGIRSVERQIHAWSGREYQVIALNGEFSRELRPAELAGIAQIALQRDQGADAVAVGPGTFPRPVTARCTESDQTALTCGSIWWGPYLDKYRGTEP